MFKCCQLNKNKRIWTETNNFKKKTTKLPRKTTSNVEWVVQGTLSTFKGAPEIKLINIIFNRSTHTFSNMLSFSSLGIVCVLCSIWPKFSFTAKCCSYDNNRPRLAPRRQCLFILVNTPTVYSWEPTRLKKCQNTCQGASKDQWFTVVYAKKNKKCSIK